MAKRILFILSINAKWQRGYNIKLGKKQIKLSKKLSIDFIC